MKPPKQTKDKILLLVSGGLDSAILIHYFLKKFKVVDPVYIKSGHFWEKAELYWLKKYLKAIQNPSLKPLTCLSLTTDDLYEKHWSKTGKKTPSASSRDDAVYLPGRNLLLIVKASVLCALKKIHYLGLGPLRTNPFPDASPSFFKTMSQACSQGLNFFIRIHTPFLSFTKNEVMALGKHLPLQFTFSCLAPRGFFHCGKCNKCAERKKAFRKACLIDRTRYAV